MPEEHARRTSREACPECGVVQEIAVTVEEDDGIAITGPPRPVDTDAECAVCGAEMEVAERLGGVFS